MDIKNLKQKGKVLPNISIYAQNATKAFCNGILAFCNAIGFLNREFVLAFNENNEDVAQIFLESTCMPNIQNAVLLTRILR